MHIKQILSRKTIHKRSVSNIGFLYLLITCLLWDLKLYSFFRFLLSWLISSIYRSVFYISLQSISSGKKFAWLPHCSFFSLASAFFNSQKSRAPLPLFRQRMYRCGSISTSDLICQIHPTSNNRSPHLQYAIVRHMRASTGLLGLFRAHFFH